MAINHFIYTICFILFIINILYCKNIRHPWKSGFLGSISGILALIPATFLLHYFGFALTVNLFTMVLSAILGIPGVILCSIYTILW